jgi:hypothetical protein
MKRIIRFTLLLCLCCPILVWAQITFQWTDLPIDPGTVIDYENSDVLVPIPVDPGSAGANQSWDFTGMTVSESFQHHWVDPATTPHASIFPEANRCVEYDQSHWGYYKLNSSGLWWLGQDTSIYHNGEAVYVYPCTFGDSWTTSWWVTPYPQTTVVDSIEYEVDGWGTLTDQMGTFNCLRFKRHLFMTIITPYTNVTTSYWGYDWFVPGYGDIVMMESEMDETSPNFTSGYFRRMTGINTGIRPMPTGPSLPNEVALEAAYPNPFNPSTQLTFSLAKSGNVSLVVVDHLGRQVAQLANGWFAGGRYQATFDGSKLATGLYLAKLNVDGAVYVQKLVLIK